MDTLGYKLDQIWIGVRKMRRILSNNYSCCEPISQKLNKLPFYLIINYTCLGVSWFTHSWTSWGTRWTKVDRSEKNEEDFM